MMIYNGDYFALDGFNGCYLSRWALMFVNIIMAVVYLIDLSIFEILTPQPVS